MLKTRIYVDTSVIGGCLDDEFKEHSTRLFNEAEFGKKILIISDLVLLELEGAPEDVRGVLDNISNESKEYVFLNEESIELANAYL
jgi:hypothetical protein